MHKTVRKIDILGTSGQTMVYGECKSKHDLVDTQALDKLILCSQMFPYVDNH